MHWGDLLQEMFRVLSLKGSSTNFTHKSVFTGEYWVYCICICEEAACHLHDRLPPVMWVMSAAGLKKEEKCVEQTKRQYLVLPDRFLIICF